MRSITFTRRTRTIILTGVAGAVAVGGVALGSIPAPTGEISACAKNSTGLVRLIDTANNEHCTASETALSWNVNGRAGKAGKAGTHGPKGPTGPVGAKGPAGAHGAAGDAGPTGAKGPNGLPGAKGNPGNPGGPGPVGGSGATGPPGDSGNSGPAGPGGSSQISNLVDPPGGPSLGPDNAIKYLAFTSLSPTSSRTGTVSASAVIRGNAGGPTTFDFGACSGPTGAGMPTYFSAATVQTVTLQPGQLISLTTARSKTFPPGSDFAGICIRVSAGLVDLTGGANGVLTLY